MDSKKLTRRKFVKAGLVRSAAGMAATSSLSATSYARLVGANDRIALGIVGPGSRGHALMNAVVESAKTKNAEMVAVCDIWMGNREHAKQTVTQKFGKEPKAFKYLPEMLAMKELDGVLIATGDHQHATCLVDVVQAGKDAYCEKCMANLMDEAKEARDAVLKSKQVVQLGTQGLSSPDLLGLAEFIKSGRLGKISKVEMAQASHENRWMYRPEVTQIKKEETDWKVWLANRKPRPFDPHLYFCYRIYKDFSGGITDQWLSHSVAAVQLFMNDEFPFSCSSNGGVFVWHDKHPLAKHPRENPDTYQCTFAFPSGFLFSYATSFGTGYPGSTRIYGTNGTIEATRGESYIALPKGGKPSDTLKNKVLPEEVNIQPVDAGGSHMDNFLDCMRSRKQPRAHIGTGYAHSVAVMMATESYRQGKMLYYDKTRDEIVDQPPLQISKL